MSATAVVHFVGIIMLTQSIQPAPPGTASKLRAAANEPVVAIMPMIPPPTAQNPNQRFIVAAPTSVEPHTAILMFEPCDLVSSAGWEIKRLNDDFVYVELNHDAITFGTGRANPIASLAGLPVPHSGGTLQGDYKPPQYRGAAAVLTIPNGKLRSCMAQPVNRLNQSIDRRRDTELYLETDGALTISAPPKRLVVKGDSRVVFGNIPTSSLTAITTGHAVDPHLNAMSRPHYIVYCQMTGTEGTTGCMPAPASCPPPNGSKRPVTDGCLPCGDNTLVQIDLNARPHKLEPPLGMTSWECSNSQYP
jgi:hypothetical protein